MIQKRTVNAILAMGHQADLAHCYKFYILKTKLPYTIFCNIILGLGKTTNSQDRFLAIQNLPIRLMRIATPSTPLTASTSVAGCQ
jgi:hypothetical protein